MDSKTAITSSDIERFYTAKKLNSSCNVCGQKNWTIADPPDEKTSWIIGSGRTDGAVVMPIPGIPTVVMVCSNCFNARSHALIPVKEWLAQNSTDAKGENGV